MTFELWKKAITTSEFLANASEILQIQLHRIEMRYGNVHNKMKFAEKLHFRSNHFISLLSNVRGEEIHYELSSIQMHFGESPQEGHYTITFKNKDKTWTMVNDTFLNRYQAFKGLSGLAMPGESLHLCISPTIRQSSFGWVADVQ